MKKVTLLVFLLLAACSSDSENIDTSSSEIESEDNPNNGIAREFAYQYTGGQWAHLYLWSLDDANYEKLMIEYYRNWAENESKNPGEGWRITFEDLFDMTVDDFYRDFDAFMLKDKSVQMSILPSNEEMQNRKVSK